MHSMTSSYFLSSFMRILRSISSWCSIRPRNYTSMSRNISPPPAKRRRTSVSKFDSASTQNRSAPHYLPPLEASNIRIFSWNVNGISPFLQKSITSFFSAPEPLDGQDEVPPASLRGFLHRHKWPSILLLQEVKIATKDIKTQDAVRTAVNAKLTLEAGKDGPTYEAHFVLPNDPYNARGLRGNGKVYGVCSILRTDLHDRYHVNHRSVAWDKEGRISVLEINCSSKKLAVFNIYAVNGTDNPYRDPKTGAVSGTRHDRKLQFHRLLMQECLDLEVAGWDVLLAGDMNVAPDARDGYPKLRTFPKQHALNRADFHRRLLEGKDRDGNVTGLNGVDVWRKMHGEERRYTYYSRGRTWGTSCDRVDYAIAGRKAWEKGMVRASGIMNSERERGSSDHCPIWVDICLEPETGEGGGGVQKAGMKSR
ncbi:Endonuclease/exonuclease/phosphatase [Phaeosphaeria sp. MPI-PUGE-AT-0046c]|nr:Endonuclease/exonuclease/phosphatase [Phaeosphaeria sp. MPI-PUGE-AT-0046c]